MEERTGAHLKMLQEKHEAGLRAADEKALQLVRQSEERCRGLEEKV
jgi:hypothetical protein